MDSPPLPQLKGSPSSKTERTFEQILQAIAEQMPCEDCGLKADAERDAENERAEADRQADVLARRVARSGLPRMLQGNSLDTLDDQVRELMRAFAERQVDAVALYGSFGVGKTHAAAAAFQARLEHGPGRWFYLPTLFARLAAGFDSPAREEALAALASRRGALVLDDIDKARPTEYGAEIILTAVDEAVTNGDALIITTNLKFSELAKKWPEPYGDAIASRLAGYCQVLTMTGADRRLARPA
ncbi:MAG: ATP-binding protein [Thermoleophilaceae bacterium]|nr:ATP-binding protein [Thermoleophilaceae bacterium]